MAEPGTDVSFAATVRADPIQVAQVLGQTLQGGGNYLEDTQIVPIGPTTFRVTRRYMPQWAIIVGIIGLLLCLVGLLAFFIRDTEELTIDIRADPDGSRVTVSGKGKASIVTTVQSVLGRFDGYAPSSIGFATAGAQMSPDRAFWWDGTVWQSAERSAPPQAPRSPDGWHWWDGDAWRPLLPPGSDSTL